MASTTTVVPRTIEELATQLSQRKTPREEDVLTFQISRDPVLCQLFDQLISDVEAAKGYFGVHGTLAPDTPKHVLIFCGAAMQAMKEKEAKAKAEVEKKKKS